MAIRIVEIAMMNEEDGIAEFSDGIQLKFVCIPQLNLLISYPVSYGCGKVRKYKKRVEALRRHLSLTGALKAKCRRDDKEAQLIGNRRMRNV